MKTHPEIEEVLRQAPRPEPPAELLKTLHSQIQLPPPSTSRPACESNSVQALRSLWRRIVMPFGALAGAVGLIAICLIVFSSFGTTRTLATSLQSLAQVRSVHVIERVRGGDSKPIIKDPKKKPMEWPNYYTSIHPENPLVTSEHWFAVDPKNVGSFRLRTTHAGNDVWRENNRMLTIDRATGARTVQLITSQFSIGGILVPVLSVAQARLHEIPPARMGLTEVEAASLWCAEDRVRVIDEDYLIRTCINRASGLPVKIQFWTVSYPNVAPEVLMHEWEFTDYNVEIPQEKFAFEITDDDLNSLGISSDELNEMGLSAISIQVTGDQGVDVVGTVTDDTGKREIHGTLPFTFVHRQKGSIRLDFRTSDGELHGFGARFNDTSMWTRARHIKGEASERGSSLQSVN